jgi:hypothetical protein
MARVLKPCLVAHSGILNHNITEFVITEFVITEFDCNSEIQMPLSKGPRLIKLIQTYAKMSNKSSYCNST